MKLGEEVPLSNEYDILNFPNGEEIVGIYGMMGKDQGVANHFVSIGFIINQCKNENLQLMSRELGRRQRGEKDDRDGFPILVAVVVILSAIVLSTCCYCILKKRGTICKRKPQTDAQAKEAQAVQNASAT